MTKNQETQSNSEDVEIQTFTDLPALYQAYARKVFHYHYSRVQNLHEAEDLTSLTFMSAWEKWHTLRDPTKAVSWLFTIARNKAFDHFRNRRTIQHETLNDEMSPTLSPGFSHVTPDTQERLLDLRGLLDQLSEMEQELIRLRLVSELPFKQIALVLREPETRIKNVITGCWSAFKPRWSKNEHPNPTRERDPTNYSAARTSSGVPEQFGGKNR